MTTKTLETLKDFIRHFRPIAKKYKCESVHVQSSLWSNDGNEWITIAMYSEEKTVNGSSKYSISCDAQKDTFNVKAAELRLEADYIEKTS